jgi:hypothetical protein
MEAYPIFRTILIALDVLVSLLAAGAAVGTAVYCTKKELSPVGAWMIAAALLGFLLSTIAIEINYSLLTDLVGLRVTRWTGNLIMLGFIAFWVVFNTGLAKLRPPTAGGEGSRG